MNAKNVDWVNHDLESLVIIVFFSRKEVRHPIRLVNRADMSILSNVLENDSQCQFLSSAS